VGDVIGAAFERFGILTLGINIPISVDFTSKIADASGFEPSSLIATPWL
jgi:hypothetical protein